MVNHFENTETAVSHLVENGFSLKPSGYWVSKNGQVRASVHPIGGQRAVRVAFDHVPNQELIRK